MSFGWWDWMPPLRLRTQPGDGLGFGGLAGHALQKFEGDDGFHFVVGVIEDEVAEVAVLGAKPCDETIKGIGLDAANYDLIEFFGCLLSKRHADSFRVACVNS